MAWLLLGFKTALKEGSMYFLTSWDLGIAKMKTIFMANQIWLIQGSNYLEYWSEVLRDLYLFQDGQIVMVKGLTEHFLSLMLKSGKNVNYLITLLVCTQCERTRNFLFLKNISWNQPLSKAIAFTKFLICNFSRRLIKQPIKNYNTL